MNPQLGHGFLQPHSFLRTSNPHRWQVGRGLGLAVGAGEERVASALVSDGGFWSMAAVHNGLVGQDKQLALDALDQRVVVAAGQIGPADGPGEQDVTAEYDSRTDQADAPGRMAGRVTDHKFERSHPHRVPGRVGAIGRRQRLGCETVPLRLFGDPVVERAVGRMQPHGRAGLLFQARHTEHVIEVAVGEPDRGGPRVQSLEFVEDEPRGFAGIDHGAFAGGLIDHDVTVLDELTVGDRDDLHATVAFAFFSRSWARYFSTAMAAVVASPTAVVIWRVIWARTSPAANRPGTDVIIFSSVSRYPAASCLG